MTKFEKLQEKGLELTEKVRSGEMNEQTVFVCHFNKPDMDKKPLRNIPPTKCIVLSNLNLPKNKIVHYSGSHYAPLNAKGVATKKVIAPQDNTGFRGRIGNSLYTFDNESDCIELWNMQLSEYVERIDDKLKNYAATLNEEKNKIKSMKL